MTVEPAAGNGSSGKVRVLWLIKSLGPGGAERLLCLTAEKGDHQSFEYEAAYVLPWKDTLVGELERAGVRVHCLRGDRDWDLRWLSRLRRMLVEGRYDIVHSHSPYTAGLARLIAQSIPSRARPSLMATEHVPWRNHPPTARFLNRSTYHLDAADVAVSKSVWESVPPRLRRRVRSIVHGIDLPSAARAIQHRDSIRVELGFTDQEVVVGTVANYRRQKGYPDLLAAARRVIDAGLPVRFVAVGQGPLEEEILALHRSYDLGDRFLLLGYREDPGPVLAACDVFVLSSLWEGLPLVVMEALAIGLPIVATAVGGTPEAVTHGVEGLLVPPGRPALLAEAIQELVLNPDKRKDMRRAAIARAADFDVGRAVASIEAIYREVALLRQPRRSMATIPSNTSALPPES